MSKKTRFVEFADWLLMGKHIGVYDGRDQSKWVKAMGELKNLGVQKLLVTHSSAHESESIEDYDYADTLIIVLPVHPSINLIAHIASLRADGAYVWDQYSIALFWH